MVLCRHVCDQGCRARPRRGAGAGPACKARGYGASMGPGAGSAQPLQWALWCARSIERRGQPAL